MRNALTTRQKWLTFGGAWLALGLIVRAFERKPDNPPSVVKSSPVDTEIVRNKIPIEFTRGDETTDGTSFSPIDGSATVLVAHGTQVQRLEEPPSQPAPRGMGRFRVLSGPYVGRIGHARLTEIRAVR